MKKVSVILLLLQIVVINLYADVVHLRTGGKVEGRVTDLGSELKVEGAIGTTTISKDKVVSIEKKETAYETYLNKSVELRTDDLEGHYQLAIWCKEKKLPTQADREFETVLKINPDHEDARKELGYVVKYEGKWMTEDEAKIAQGYVKYKGMWFKKEDYEVRKKNDEEDERIKKAYSEFQKEANKLGARNSKTRAEAYEKATAIADKNNLQDVKPWLADAKAYSDKYWDTITEMEGRNAVLEVRAFLTTVRKMESFQTRIGGVLGGAGPAPTVTIQQPTMDTVIFKGTVLMPLGGGSGLKRNE